MNNLLNENFSRLLKSKMFWGSVAFLVIMGALMPILRYRDMVRFNSVYNLDDRFFTCVILITIVSAALCSLFIGTEYSDGTIRNKIIAGHSRVSIYFSDLLTVTAANYILCTAYFVVYFFVGQPLLGSFTNDTYTIFLLVISAYLLIFAYCSIFVVLAMLISNKAIAAVACIMFSFIIILMGSGLFSKLNETQMIPSHTSINGSPVYDEDTPNPKYLTGTKRHICEFTYNFLPGGQTIQFTCMRISNPFMLSLYSCIVITITTSFGVSFFKRKDI